MRHSFRGWTVKRKIERLKRKDGFNKFNMSRCVDTTKGGFKTQIGSLSLEYLRKTHAKEYGANLWGV